MSETPDQTLPEPGHPGRPDQGLPGFPTPPDRPGVDPHPGRGPEKGPHPDHTLPEPEKPGRPTPKK